ncbi:MAG: energy-coupling factor transporter transmembrane component T [Lachnospiraceae bacterium]|nr:energy-coupling factor transporter transmembrane component T [Lachnospiraceae bacterium]MDY5742985.1 energy-coupling factor transporter transmembrane component T [Lachnospiraceae bacterium]
MNRLRFDALTIIIINAMLPTMCSLFPSDKMVALTFLIAFFVLLVSGNVKRMLKIGITIGIFLAVYILSETYINNRFLSAWFRMMLLFTPSFSLAAVLISEYKSSEVVSALQKLRLPKMFIIGLTVTLRYVPTFYREFKLIKKAMNIRGVKFSVLHPIRTFEYMMVPQLFRCVALSNELTSAGLTKGISAAKRRTSYFNHGFTLIDYLTFSLLAMSYGAIISGLI